MARALLGAVELSTVQSDNPIHEMDVTDKPVERGQDIKDHVRLKPVTIDITGTIVGDDAANKLEQLRTYQKNGELLTYINRVVYRNMVIESLETTHDAGIENGFRFSISLKKVRIAVPREVTILNVPPKQAGKKQAQDDKEIRADEIRAARSPAYE